MPKLVHIALAAVSLAYLPAALADSTDNPWYVGGKVGWSDFYRDKFDTSRVSPRNEDHNSVGGGAFVGYQFLPWLAVEGGYDYLGKYKYDNAITGTREEFTAQGIQLGLKFSADLVDSLNAYARLGGMGFRTKGLGSHDNGFAPLAALGMEYAFNRDWSSRLEYQWTGRLGDQEKVGLRTDNGLLSVGLVYHFGGQPAPAPVPVAVQEPVRPVPVAPREFKLSSDVLFDFNKSTLKPSGTVALDQLLGQIQAETSKDVNLTVVGHTDRIGTDAYNLKLSKRRAQTVADYFVSKGMQASLVSMEGAGESMPETGNRCDGVKPRKALIACLAPDRRVVVKVSGMSAQ